jgi:hypothetical protein
MAKRSSKASARRSQRKPVPPEFLRRVELFFQSSPEKQRKFLIEMFEADRRLKKKISKAAFEFEKLFVNLR